MAKREHIAAGTDVDSIADIAEENSARDLVLRVFT